MSIRDNLISLNATERQLFSITEQVGIEAYAVGGAVRDAVLGRACHDLDIAVSTPPNETKRLLSPYMTVIETGVSFGTVTAVLNGVPFELTTFRADVGIGDGRHPCGVEFVSGIKSDLARRDFTVNAMAWSPNGGIIDLFDGVGDIERKLIRCVGEPLLRFNEDALRILRALRFAAVLGFEIHDDTADAIHKSAEKLEGISAERILAELSRLICGVSAGKIIREYGDVFCRVLPRCFLRSAAAFDKLPLDESLRFAALFKSADDAQFALSSLKAPKTLQNRVTALCRLSPLPDDEAALAVIGIDVGEKLLFDAAALCDDGKTREAIMRAKQNGRLVTPATLALTPTDLLALGVPHGAEIGKTMHELCVAVACGRCRNEKHALENHLFSTNRTNTNRTEDNQ